MRGLIWEHTLTGFRVSLWAQAWRRRNRLPEARKPVLWLRVID